MKKTRKIFALLVSMSLAIACVTGCGSNEGSTPAAPDTPDAPDAPEAAETITFTYCANTTVGLVDETMDMFAQRLEELSGGRIVGEGYAPGSIGTEQELLDATLLGDLTATVCADTFTLQASGIDDWVNLPGLVTSYEEADERILSPDGDLSKLLDENFASAGLVRLAACNNGFRVLATYEPMETLDDLQGLKMRAGNSPTLVTLYNEVGAIPTVVDSSEVMTALEQGTVDAVENSLFNIANQGFLGVLDHILAINYVYSARSIVCPSDWYNTLSAEDQALVKQAAQEAADWANEEYMKQYYELVEDPQWTVREMDAEQAAAFDAASQVVVDTLAADYDPAILEVVNAGK